MLTDLRWYHWTLLAALALLVGAWAVDRWVWKLPISPETRRALRWAAGLMTLGLLLLPRSGREEQSPGSEEDQDGSPDTDPQTPSALGIPPRPTPEERRRNDEIDQTADAAVDAATDGVADSSRSLHDWAGWRPPNDRDGE